MHSLSRRALLGGAVAAGLTVAGAARPASAADGLQVVSVDRQSARDLVATVSSTALNRQVKVRVLLPAGYDDDPAMRYPVLYLFHGSYGDHDSFTDETSLRALTESLGLVVVLPDGGHGGWYSDHKHTTTAPMNWETFHTRQLVPAIDENLRTLPWGNARAAAGFSAGGFGAALYAGRNPWMFGSVSSFSGPLDAFNMLWRREMGWEPTFDGENAGAIYGTDAGSEDHADLVDRNPSTYASALVDHRIRLYSGDGDDYENAMRTSTAVFHDALVAAGAKDLGGQVISGAVHTMETAQRALEIELPGIWDWILKPGRY